VSHVLEERRDASPAPGWVEMVGRRIAQYVLDLALALGIGFLAGLLAGLVAIPLLRWEVVPPMTIVYAPMYTFAVVTLVADLLVHVWVPLVRGGVTPGMWVLGLRVTTVLGDAPSVRDYLVRWFLFTVDGLLLGAVAAVSIALTRRRQRVGDLLARTVVVRVS
jgi:uncharacterized RDD family membrane protein YckC